MSNHVYKNYKSIRKFLDKNVLLSASVKIDTAVPVFVPVLNLAISRRRNSFNMKFDTPDRNTRVIDPSTYKTFTHYMDNVSHAHKGWWFPRGDDKTISYLECCLKFPVRMYKHRFTIHRKRFYELMILSPADYSMYMLVSPDVQKDWLNRMGLNDTTISPSNLWNILDVIQYHLAGRIEEVDLYSNNLNITDMDIIRKLSFDKKKLHITNDLTSINYYVSNTTGSVNHDRAGNTIIHLAGKTKHDVSLSLVVKNPISNSILRVIA